MTLLTPSLHLADWEPVLSLEAQGLKNLYGDVAVNFFTSTELESLRIPFKDYFKDRQKSFTDSEIRAWFDESSGRIQVIEINNEIGKGVFATKSFDAGCPIACYAGVVKAPSEDDDQLEYCWKVDWDVQTRNKNTSSYQVLIDGYSEKDSNFTRFINGTTIEKEANVDAISIPTTNLKGEFSLQILYIARKRVNEFEQLLVYYGSDYQWEKTPKPMRPGSFVLVGNGPDSWKVIVNPLKSSTHSKPNRMNIEPDDEDYKEEDVSDCSAERTESDDEDYEERVSDCSEESAEESANSSSSSALEEELESSTSPSTASEPKEPTILPTLPRRILIKGKYKKIQKVIDKFTESLNELALKEAIPSLLQKRILTATNYWFRTRHAPECQARQRLDNVLTRLNDSTKARVNAWAKEYVNERGEHSSLVSQNCEDHSDDPVWQKLAFTDHWPPIKNSFFLTEVADLRGRLSDEILVNIHKCALKDIRTIRSNRKLSPKKSKLLLGNHLRSSFAKITDPAFVEDPSLVDKMVKIVVEIGFKDGRSYAGKHKVSANNSEEQLQRASEIASFESPAQQLINNPPLPEPKDRQKQPRSHHSTEPLIPGKKMNRKIEKDRFDGALSKILNVAESRSKLKKTINYFLNHQSLPSRSVPLNKILSEMESHPQFQSIKDLTLTHIRNMTELSCSAAPLIEGISSNPLLKKFAHTVRFGQAKVQMLVSKIAPIQHRLLEEAWCEVYTVCLQTAGSNTKTGKTHEAIFKRLRKLKKQGSFLILDQNLVNTIASIIEAVISKDARTVPRKYKELAKSDKAPAMPPLLAIPAALSSPPLPATMIQQGQSLLPLPEAPLLAIPAALSSPPLPATMIQQGQSLLPLPEAPLLAVPAALSSPPLPATMIQQGQSLLPLPEAPLLAIPAALSSPPLPATMIQQGQSLLPLPEAPLLAVPAALPSPATMIQQGQSASATSLPASSQVATVGKKRKKSPTEEEPGAPSSAKRKKHESSAESDARNFLVPNAEKIAKPS